MSDTAVIVTSIRIHAVTSSSPSASRGAPSSRLPSVVGKSPLSHFDPSRSAGCCGRTRARITTRCRTANDRRLSTGPFLHKAARSESDACSHRWPSVRLFSFIQRRPAGDFLRSWRPSLREDELKSLLIYRSVWCANSTHPVPARPMSWVSNAKMRAASWPPEIWRLPGPRQTAAARRTRRFPAVTIPNQR